MALLIDNNRKRANAAYRILRLLPYHATPVRPGVTHPEILAQETLTSILTVSQIVDFELNLLALLS